MGVAFEGKTRFWRTLGWQSVTPKCLVGYVGFFSSVDDILKL